MNEQEWKDHVTTADLAAYIGDELPEHNRERIELHIAACEPCMALFMNAIEASEVAESDPASDGAAEAKAVVIPDMKKLGKRVVDILLAESARKNPVMRAEPARRQSFLQRPVVHFAAAAAITLLLLGTGTFSGLSAKLGEMDSHSATTGQTVEKDDEQPPQGPTWSDRMVTRTSSWFDKLEKDRFK
ncbi:zf-HC2 domain-containing protein [Paenibacillus sp. BK720]|uniref:zf-HC2 domain-containing protein n=1 Tax=Paenibacillus sp. BK720 TaxID=2587092 RepID=UPI0014216E14|nr:zf-HC2 domain-containing protein [Paenibacillus sp. BK720]NIK72341.1 anti-sigma factor RsiW [Paenibacillus sp. BK720]